MDAVSSAPAPAAVDSPDSAKPAQMGRIVSAPAGTGEAVTGRTLTSLLDEACSMRDNPRAFNQRTNEGWQVSIPEQVSFKVRTDGFGAARAGFVTW